MTTFVDHAVTHSGKAARRMENVGRNPARHCRIAHSIPLVPHRQYRLSLWLKSQNRAPADPEVKVLTDGLSAIQSFSNLQKRRFPNHNRAPHEHRAGTFYVKDPVRKQG